jgi:triosephosphate isomerase
MAGRKFFVGGNWKMNGNKNEIKSIVETLNGAPLNDNTGTGKMIIILMGEIF